MTSNEAAALVDELLEVDRSVVLLEKMRKVHTDRSWPVETLQRKRDELRARIIGKLQAH